MMTDNFLSVSQLNSIIKSKLEGDASLRKLSVRGEISNYKEYERAAYFSLKEGNKSVISCVMWKDASSYLPFKPKEGDDVVVYASISLYVARGQYQLTVHNMELFGQGQELLRLEALKRKLSEEGLFDVSKKKAIHSFPSKIGVIVGEGSAAEADLITNINRRWPVASLFVFNSLVQGKEAPKDLMRAINLSKNYDLDVLIVARGGGSNEDLSAFNDESLVRTIYACETPVIAAVGHEIDFTLVDYVADKRVSTPTGAAEAATPNILDIYQTLDDFSERLDSSINKYLKDKTDAINAFASRPFFKNPGSIYEKNIIELNSKKKALETYISILLQRRKDSVSSYKKRLSSISPYAVLNRGYSLVYDVSGKNVKSISQINVGDKYSVKMSDGTLFGEIIDKEGNKI